MSTAFNKMIDSFQSSIRLKMLMYIVSPVLLVVITLVTASILYFLDRSEAQVKQFQLTQMELTLQRLSGAFDSLESVALRTAELLGRESVTEESALYSMVETNVITSDLVFGSAIAFERGGFPDKTGLFAPYAYRTANGVASTDIGMTNATSGSDYADGSHDWFEIPRATRSGNWTTSSGNAQATNTLISTFSVPILWNNDFIGVTTIDIEPRSLFPESGLTTASEFIIDQNNRLVSQPQVAIEAQGELFTLNSDYDSSSLGQLLATSQNFNAGLFELETLAGDTIWALHSQLPQTGWRYINLISASEAMQSTYEQVYMNIGITIASILSLIIIIWHITSLITRPISVLHDITQRASRGEAVDAFELPGNDEISRLGTMLGEMFKVVRQKSEELEDKVRQRTRKLKSIEMESTRQRNLMESTLNGVDTGIIMYDKDLQVLAANFRFLQITGIQVNDWKYMNVEEMTEMLYRSTLKQDFTLEFSKKRLVFDEAFTTTIELKSGSILEIKHAPMRGGDGFIRTYEDVTVRQHQQEQLDKRLAELEEARKASINMMQDAEDARRKIHESQQLLEGFIDNSTAIIYVKNKQGRYLLVNKEWEQVTNISRSATIGKRDSDLFDPEQAEKFALSDTRVMISREPQQYDESPVEGRTYLSLKFPLYDINGEVNGVAGISTDVTQQKILEEQLRAARDNAEQAAEAKANFLASMSHEIRTPMNVVIGMVDLLMQTSLSEDQSHMLRSIANSGHSLLTIINDILDFSKIEAGRLSLESIPIQIVDAVEDATRTVAVNIHDKDLRLVTFIDPDLPLFVYGDVVRLRQILVNLVGNAIKFTDKGTIRVTAEDAGRSKDEVRLRLSIQDPGIGISTEAQQQLFTPFTQAESSTTRKYGGTGLGLSICERLSTLMGGTIGVKSKLGEGSTFTVEIPFKISEQQPQDNTRDLDGLHVLVVSDDDFECSVMQRYLDYWHANVSVIDSLEAFTAKCRHEQNSGNPVSLAVIGASWNLSESLTWQAAAVEAGLPKLKLVKLHQDTRDDIRFDENGIVAVQTNPFKRAEFLTAVAVCAGRASPEVHYRDKIEILKPDRPLLSVDEARAAGTLILVAEDNPTNRDIIGRQLKVLGYTCEMAEDGVKALAAWESGDYALLLTDCHMPNMDGFELTAKIRKSEHESGTSARFPIVAVTANALHGEAEHCLAAGMDAYLSKPLNMKELANTIQNWLPDAGNLSSKPVTEPEKMVGSMTDNKDQADENRNQGLLDLSLLTGILGDDPVELKEVLDGFIKSSSATLIDINKAHADGDVKTVSISAHKLKSAARYVGATELADICYALEIAGKNSDTKTLDSEILKIQPAFSAVVQFIQSIKV